MGETKGFASETSGRVVGVIATLSPLLVAGVVYSIAGIAVVLHGRVTADEGWYLFVSDQVYSGGMPYRDFLFTQPPLLPYVYGFLFCFLKAEIATGRWLSFFFGLASVLLVVRSAQRMAGNTIAWIAAALLAGNMSFVFDTCLLKTQSLTCFCVSLMIFSLSLAVSNSSIAVCFLFALLSGMTRASMLALLPLLFAYFLVVAPGHRRTVLISMAASASALAVAAGVFWAGGNLLWGIWHFHKEYYEALPESVGQRGQFVLNAFANQGAMTAMVLMTSIGMAIFGRTNEGVAFAGRAWALVTACWAATTALHFLPRMPYATYQTSNYPLGVVAVSLAVGALAKKLPRNQQVAASALCVLAAVATIPFEEYVVNSEGAGTPESIAAAVGEIEKIGKREARILTFNPELAVGSGMTLLEGYELGQFSYFHWIEEKEAKKRRVSSASKFRNDVVGRRPDVIALTKRDILLVVTGDRPADGRSVLSMIGRGYRERAQIAGFGQFDDTLYIFTRRERLLSGRRN